MALELICQVQFDDVKRKYATFSLYGCHNLVTLKIFKNKLRNYLIGLHFIQASFVVNINRPPSAS